MEKNKNIAWALFQYEKISLLIISIVFLANATVNFVIFLLVGSPAYTFIIGQILGILFLFVHIYIFNIALNEVITTIPFLFSLNTPRSTLAKAVIFNGLRRSSIITAFLFLVVVIIRKSVCFSMPIILGIVLNSGGFVDDLLLVLTVFLILSLFYSFVSFFCLVGNSYGWQYLLGIIFIASGSVFFLIRPLILLFVFGWGFNIWIVLLLVLLAGLSIINYRLIKNFEYKY
ncbi:MAG: hypothetical protein GX175_10455 [Halanaerobiaceae bacterium]|nr:hypothetical protein [Halanaerobiaceae bacterium]